MHDEAQDFRGGERRRGAGKFRVLQNTEAEPVLQSADAENCLLSAVLMDPATVLPMCQRAQLAAGAFVHAGRRVVFAKALELHGRGAPVALDVIAEELAATGELEAVGGYGLLVEISQKLPTTAQAGYFLGRVRDLWVARQAVRRAAELPTMLAAVESPEDMRMAVRDVAVRFAKMAEFLAEDRGGSMADRAREATQAALEAMSGKVDRSHYLSTGLVALDAKIWPFDVLNEDWYVVIAAPPSVGKSSFARQIANANLEKGKRGMVFLLETGDKGWLLRMAGQHCRVNVRREELARDLRENQARLKNRMVEQEAWAGERLWFFDDVFAVEGIEQRVRTVNRELRERDIANGVPPEQARGLDFVIVDYLQLVAPPNPREPREQQVAAISRRFKKLFKAENVTGFVLAQLNRKSRDEQRRPRQSDLRESGAIEQDADRILALHVPAEARDGTAQDENTLTLHMEVCQLKSRNGPQGIVDVLFHRRHTRFEDAPHRGEARPGAPKGGNGYGRKEQQT